MPDSGAWSFGDSEFTIDLWVNFSVLNDINPFVAHNEGSSAQNKWVFEYKNSKLNFHINTPTIGNPGVDISSAAVSIPVDQWHHLAVTRSGSTYSFYLDGVLISTATDSHTIPDAAAPLTIGSNNETPGDPAVRFINGFIDEVEIFQRALIPQEIQAIVVAGSAGKCKPATECTPPPPNMVGWYPGDGDASDTSPVNNNATLQGGATFAAGMVGQAFSLNGTDAFVEAPANAAQDPTAAGSQDAWVLFNQTPSSAGHIREIIGKGSGGNDFDLQAETDDRFRFYVAGGNRVASNTIIQAGVRYHVAGTWDATGLRIYVNGVLENTNGVQNLTRGQSGLPLQIGNQPNFGPRLFNGLIDEAEIFDRALTGQEVFAIYNAGSFGKCKPSGQTLTLTGAVSRKTHGSAGDFDLPLVVDPASDATVEPRSGGPTQVIFTFSDNVVATDGMISANEFTITNATFSSASISGNEITLNLTGVVDQSVITIALSGIEDTNGTALSGDNDVAIRALLGDVNQNLMVDRSDITVLRAHMNEPVDNTNFVFDLDLNAIVGPHDGRIVRRNKTHTVP